MAQNWILISNNYSHLSIDNYYCKVTNCSSDPKEIEKGVLTQKHTTNFTQKSKAMMQNWILIKT